MSAVIISAEHDETASDTFHNSEDIAGEQQENRESVSRNDEEIFTSVAETFTPRSNLSEESEKLVEDVDDDVAVKNGITGEYFMLSTLEEMKELIKDYSERTASQFVVNKKTQKFGLPGMFLFWKLETNVLMYLVNWWV